MTQALVGNPGDLISVAPGTYNLTLGEVFPIVMKSGVQLIATGSASETIIDATGANARLFNASDSNVSTVIQGFTITGGFNVGPADGSNTGGGAILISGANQIKIRRNIFTGNEARGFGGNVASFSKEGYGGAISVAGGLATIENNIFRANTARGGDGVAGTGGAAGSGHGGAISGSAAIIINNTFYANVAQGGSGGSSSGQGGAGGSAFSSAVEMNNTSVVNNIFVNNSSIGGTGGSGSPPGAAGNAIGGAVTANTSPSNTNNLFFGNTSNGTTGTIAVFLDPQFHSAPANLKIMTGSPATAAGTSTGAPATDFAGVTRPSPPAIGAYEPSAVTVAATRYVNASTGSNTSNNCSVLASPCKTITYAMTQALAGNPGDLISVAPGTHNLALGEIFPIAMKSGVQLVATGSSSNTFIDAASDTVKQGVLTSIGNASASARIEGFTIRNGRSTTQSQGGTSTGGGIVINSSSATFTITRNIFNGNQVTGAAGNNGTTAPSGGLAWGGAIYGASSTVAINNNIFTNNVAQGGNGFTDFNTAPCTNRNGGRGEGGAILISGTGSITNNTFYNNSAQGGGGGSGTACSGGGGIGTTGALATFPGISVSNNIFAANFAVGGTGSTAGTASVGALAAGGATVTNNLFFGNTVSGAASTDDTTGTSPVLADPQFHSAPAILKIKIGSPATGAGTSTGAPATDFAGVTRPSPPAIGAYEPSAKSSLNPILFFLFD